MITQNLTFLLNKNLGFPATEEPWKSILSAEGITADVTTDVTTMNHALAEGAPDVAYVTGAGYCVMMRNGNQHYRGLVIATSKFTGQPAQCSLLVVRQDDPAKVSRTLKDRNTDTLTGPARPAFSRPQFYSTRRKGSSTHSSR
jgi:hypothetical protein